MSDTLGPVGIRLAKALSIPDEPFSIGVLVTEAARVADRLDQLNRLLVADSRLWMRLDRGRDGVLEVRVDGALQESRQQATVLRQLLAEIRRQRGGEALAPEADDVLADL